MERVERLEDVEREAEERPPFCAVSRNGTRSITTTKKIVIVLCIRGFLRHGSLSRRCVFVKKNMPASSLFLAKSA
ncbi:MAG: hypothetical protein DMG16_22635 [Acidobacteria bacterium]|nr:MAG: hypothetical protein DMG16_22635 [Acidobacteriota bacterium]